MDPEEWLTARAISPEKRATARLVLDEVRQGVDVFVALRHHPLSGGGYVAKHALVAVYRQLVESGEWAADLALLARIRMKPMRTLSGVTTVTVLTRPYPCPGDCIFCPTDARMPKSYLPDEPGRGARFSKPILIPYDQVHSRILAYEAVGPSDR